MKVFLVLAVIGLVAAYYFVSREQRTQPRRDVMAFDCETIRPVQFEARA